MWRGHLVTTSSSARQLENKLRATFRALEASQRGLTIPEHVHIIHLTAKASAALGEGDPLRIDRSLEEMGDAAEMSCASER